MKNDGMVALDLVLFANLYLTDNKVVNNLAYSTIKNNVFPNKVDQIFFHLLIPFPFLTLVKIFIDIFEIILNLAIQ